MPTKNNNNNEIAELQRSIENKFNLTGEKLLEIIGVIHEVQGGIAVQTERCRNLDNKIDSLEQFIKESLEQYEKRLSDLYLKITALENFRITLEAVRSSNNNLFSYSRWILWGFVGAFIAGAALEQSIVSPILGYIHGHL